jgi:ParB/RepB/Spo0J family partition protein
MEDGEMSKTAVMKQLKEPHPGAAPTAELPEISAGAAPDDRVERIPLDRIQPSPYNERKTFSGEKFEALKDSIRQKGVLQPVLVRPMIGDGKTLETLWRPAQPGNEIAGYELVAGERRWRASMEVGKPDILAVVRFLSTEEAMECTMIENLQRDDLTEIEAARGFKRYLDQFGAASIERLAQRVSMSTTYIRRRVKVLELPDEILDMWDKKDLSYFHLEQLVRLKGKKDVLRIVKQFMQNFPSVERRPVSGLIETIRRDAPPLKWAKFDTTECKTCPCSTAHQASLYGFETADDNECLDPGCFKRRQIDYLMANWKKTSIAKKRGTNGFRLIGNSYSYNAPKGTVAISGTPKDQCKECDNFLSTIRLSGEEGYIPVVCGNEECAKKTYKQAAQRNVEPVQNLGPEYRRKFFRERIPSACAAIPADDDRYLRLAVYRLLEGNYYAREAFYKEAFAEAKKKPLAGERDIVLWTIVEKLNGEALRKAFNTAVIVAATSQDNWELGEEVFIHIGRHFGADIKDWQLVADYLNKKEPKQLVKLGKELNIFEDPKVEEYIKDKLSNKTVAVLNKKELIAVFLKSGMNLTGKVPKEILEVS